MKKFSKIQRGFYWLSRKIYEYLCGVKLGVYIQNFDHVHIGNNVRIAPNVVIVARNHNKYDISKYDEWEDVYIDDDCWIGANAVILPSVHLGKNTIVGAGSVVTKSFPEGFCVIAGNPAKIIKKLQHNNKNEVVEL